MGRAIGSMVPVWLLAVVGAALVASLGGERYLTLLPVVMALCLLASFAIQLGLGREPGLTTRLGGSAIGALAILVAATGILMLARPGGVPIPG
ncbi:MAG: hypothetical protein HY996_11645 [Micrococcales bacterium]|nr:hypothetical protein [Micrococcales bacterium]